MKTNKGLIEYAKAMIGKPYWYGTFGLTATADLYKAKKAQYPDMYKSWNDFPKQYGERVHDCVGLIKGYLWSDSVTAKPVYNARQDVSANGMLAVSVEKGNISTMPDIEGILVFMNGHVGVYIGGGEVVEAMGHQYGVRKTKLKDRPWKNWSKCPFIVYGDTDGKDIEIKDGTWNIRAGAGTEYKILGIAKGGEHYVASETSNGWIYIPAKKGWISKKAVR